MIIYFTSAFGCNDVNKLLLLFLNVLESYFSFFLMEKSILYAKIAVSQNYYFSKTRF